MVLFPFLYLCGRMKRIYTILYIHGLGGGADSRIPSILREHFLSGFGGSPIEVVCRTYSFDPEYARGQIDSWVSELQPDLLIGESLGSLHALRYNDLPCLLVSPALNAPLYFELMAWLCLIPGVGRIFDRIYRPREGDRQRLHFTFPLLRKYIPHRVKALSSDRSSGPRSVPVHAFFGTRDHYRRSGVVSLGSWKRRFGDTFSVYEGTHFMEEEYIYSLLIPKVCDVLGIK